LVKDLSELTLKELWELFPIVVKPYDPRYPDWYREERERITAALGAQELFRIQHIGSTAVPSLPAKPTVDILLELAPDADAARAKRRLREAGWLLMKADEERPCLWLAFNKGYTPQGYAERVFHLHVRRPGDWDELYFRDWLRENPGAAADYAALKLRLAAQFTHDRDGYTDGKGAFVSRGVQQARQAFSGRYVPQI